MSKQYIFNEPGSIPGIPGTFAGVSVTVNDDGSLTVVALSPYPSFDTPEQLEELAETPQQEAAEQPE